MILYGDFQEVPAARARSAIARPRRQNPDCDQVLKSLGFKVTMGYMRRRREKISLPQDNMREVSVVGVLIGVRK